MSKRDKLRRKLRNNPKGVKFSELQTLLLRFGFVLIRIQGSHHIFRHSDNTLSEKIVIPVHGNQVSTYYVKDAITILDELFPESRETSDEGEEENE